MGPIVIHGVSDETAPRRMPALAAPTRLQLLVSTVGIGAAGLLLGVLAWRLASGPDLRQWWIPLALVGGVAAADFFSGIVHWGADTWGRDDCPLIGPRLLVPFRVHHINPDDFLRRRFVEANGDVALITIPVLLGLLAIPVDTAWGASLAVFGFAFCGVGSMTNQVHQWSHMPMPPRVVRVLQRCGLLLGRTAHAAHHARPYDRHYCITTGWCNRPLEIIAFFRQLESAITHVTGVMPRQDDRRYAMTFDAADPAAQARRD